MTVHCSHCGEPLMGSVNRCWRCGHSLVVVAGEPELPPIRRPPVNLEPVPTASLVEPERPAKSDESPTAQDLAPPYPTPQNHAAQNHAAQNHAAQNAAPADGESVPTEPIRRLPTLPTYPKQVFAESCAITSVVVGVLTAFTSILTAWSFIPALVGLVLGVVGLGSERRKTAAVGVALCCLVILIATGRFSAWAYRLNQTRQNEIFGEF